MLSTLFKKKLYFPIVYSQNNNSLITKTPLTIYHFSKIITYPLTYPPPHFPIAGMASCNISGHKNHFNDDPISLIYYLISLPSLYFLCYFFLLFVYIMECYSVIFRFLPLFLSYLFILEFISNFLQKIISFIIKFPIYKNLPQPIKLIFHQYYSF